MARKHRDVMRLLVSDIVSGALETGEMLPREVDLAAEFEVSRGVARETIRALEERGLVSVRHGRGATVTAVEEWDSFDADVLEALLETRRWRDVLEQYLECRRILEVEAAASAAQRAERKDLRALEEALTAMEESARRPPTRATEQLFHESDVAFHQALVAATGNRALGALVDRIRSALVLARFPLARPEHRVERALPEHRRIFDAVAAGDARMARDAMNAHLDTVASYLHDLRRPAARSGRAAA